jgi:hypothetical protein
VAQQAIGIEDTVEVGDVPTGPRVISLSGLAANCVLATPDRQLDLPSGQQADVTFDVQCPEPERGAIIVSVRTTAILVPAEMTFAVELDGGHRLPVSSMGTVTYADVEPGSHSVKLMFPSYCGVGLFGAPGTNPVQLVLTPGEHRTVTFQVLCIG